jgi:5-methyltetrahydrofolate--homocysteine methyltransferase
MEVPVTFREALERKVLVFDGAMGTQIQGLSLAPADFGGLEGANDLLVLTRPDLLQDIHARYLAAGADVIETNTFGSNRPKLEEYGAARRTREINFRAATLARQVADRFSTPERPRFVAGSMGPTGFLPASDDPALSRLGYAALERVYHEQARALCEGGCDALIIETSQDILELKAAVDGAARYLREAARDVPVIAQVTLDPNGRMLLGTDVGTALAILEPLPCDVIGMNCSTGPGEMRDAVRFLAAHASKPVSVLPNAGMPENVGGRATYRLDPETFARETAAFVTDFGVDVVGGCCGTTPEHIRLLAERVAGLPGGRRRGKRAVPMAASMLKAVPLDLEPRPLLVGERLNAQGSRRMKEKLLAGDLAGILSLAREQVESGAHLLDVCVALTERSDERATMARLCKLLSLGVEAPLLVDSTEPEVIAAALEAIPGRAVVNSVNLERGGERIRRVLPLVKRHGAAVVAMTIDERGMALDAERKVAIAERLHRIATEEYGLEPSRLVIDPLTFTLATGQAEYERSAVETLEAIRRIHQRLPGVYTVLGVSNISFGLARAARPILNSVFLTLATRAGLDLAIVDPRGLVPWPSIPEEERELALDLVLARRPDALRRLIERFEGRPSDGGSATRARGGEARERLRALPAEERIHQQILHRVPEGIEPALDEALARASPVSVLNDVLLPAMKDVGDRFGAGELILPFVLQSAEVMKRAVAYLERFLERDDAAAKGRVVLATVYGDVHDIGKNLVKTILANNGFEVHDLGKQVPVHAIVDKAVEVGADAIGLSALLVSTSRQMPACIEELARRGLEIPVLVGGAAINRRFGHRLLLGESDTPYAGGVYYCKDAFEGLATVQRLVDPAARAALYEETVRRARRARDLGDGSAPEAERAAAAQRARGKRSATRRLDPVPAAPFAGTRVLEDIPLFDVFPCMDHASLFKLSWGVRSRDRAEYERLLAEFRPRLAALETEAVEKRWLEGKAIYGFFPVHGDGDALVVLDPGGSGKELVRFEFPRMPDSPWLCLPDYFRPAGDGTDVAAFQVVTVGPRATERCARLEAEGRYLDAYLLHGLAVEAAEGLAEWLHRRVRRELGIEEGRGRRYSPGYPSWPELADHRKLWELLRPDRAIGVTLTEAHQMVPEQSTSALVIHHPDAAYFTVRLRPGAPLP